MIRWIASMFVVVCFFPAIAIAEEQSMGAVNRPQADTATKNTNSTANTKDQDEAYAKWEKVSEDKTMQVYVDTNNVKWEDGRATIWKMQDLNKNLRDGALSLLVAEAHYCGKKLRQEAIVIHYKGQLGSGKQISRDDNESNIVRIKPGSMDEAVYDYVCKLKH